MKDKKVETVDEFINCINNKIMKLETNTSCRLFTYRGEQIIYSTSGQPNLFRGKTYDKLVESPIYEKNIIDEVLMNKLSEHDNYLQAAMDAQHGGFPSRLLDISFNALIALFFATTPHFHQPIDTHDSEDGVVIIYAVDKMYSSNSSKLQNFFEEMIDLNSEKSTDKLHNYVHKFIDYSTINARIQAQQGGFVLFSGLQYNPIPEWKQEKIIISSECKPKIRRDLRNLFGLTIGSIYPESDNLVGYLSEKAELLVENSNLLKEDVQYELEKQLKHFLSIIIKIKYEDRSNNPKIVWEKLKEIETYLAGYVEVLKESKELTSQDRRQIYDKIENFLEEVQIRLPDDMTVISINQLKNKRSEL